MGLTVDLGRAETNLYVSFAITDFVDFHISKFENKQRMGFLTVNLGREETNLYVKYIFLIFILLISKFENKERVRLTLVVGNTLRWGCVLLISNKLRCSSYPALMKAFVCHTSSCSG